MKDTSVDPHDLPELASESTIYTPAEVEARRQQQLAQIPARQRSVFARAWKGNSRKAAIRARCLECFGYESAEVNRCTSTACPLFPYRGDRL